MKNEALVTRIYGVIVTNGLYFMYLRQVWDKMVIRGQRGFRPGYSCESLVITICQNIADSLDERIGIGAIVIDF